MTAYLDTSALLKLYVDEAGSDQTWQALQGNEAGTCLITWVEAAAALARRERELPQAQQTWSQARAGLAADWPALHHVQVTEALVQSAAELATAFGLRGYDAVQLAAARALHRALGGESFFLCFDRRLNRAAKLLGIGLPVWALT